MVLGQAVRRHECHHGCIARPQALVAKISAKHDQCSISAVIDEAAVSLILAKTSSAERRGGGVCRGGLGSVVVQCLSPLGVPQHYTWLRHGYNNL
jgi:hypothetical protein